MKDIEIVKAEMQAVLDTLCETFFLLELNDDFSRGNITTCLFAIMEQYYRGYEHSLGVADSTTPEMIDKNQVSFDFVFGDELFTLTHDPIESNCEND